MSRFDDLKTMALHHYDEVLPNVTPELRNDAAEFTRWLFMGKGSVSGNFRGPGGLYERAVLQFGKHDAESGAPRCGYREALGFVEGWLRRNMITE